MLRRFGRILLRFPGNQEPDLQFPTLWPIPVDLIPVDGVLTFHDAPVPHRGPAKIEIARVGQRFVPGCEAQRIALPFTGVVHDDLDLPRYGVPRSPAVARERCMHLAELAGIIGLHRRIIRLRLLHLRAILHFILPIVMRTVEAAASKQEQNV